MRLALLFASAAAVALCHPALAQQKKQPPAATGTFYITGFNDFEDVAIDVLLKETRSGNTITAATIDLCYPSPPDSLRRDRVIVPLKIENNRMIGSGMSQRDKTLAEFAITQTRAAKDKSAFDLTGSIRIGTRTMTLASKETTDTSEAKFIENRSNADPVIFANYDRLVEASPESLAFKVRLDAVDDFIRSLAGKPVVLSRHAITASCDELRAGEQTIRLIVNPADAAVLLEQIKARPGVIESGWSYGTFGSDRTLRFPARNWVSNGRIDADKIKATVLDVLMKSVAPATTVRHVDAVTGETVFESRRPDPLIDAVKLTDLRRYKMMTAFDRPQGSEHVLLWLSPPTSQLLDESPTPLRMAEEMDGEGEGDSGIDDTAVLEALAKVFGAQRWDNDSAGFK